MPRSGTESTSSIRRHSPTRTHPPYSQFNSQSWQTRLPRSDSPLRSESLGHSIDLIDCSVDSLSRTRASGSRTRWNARTSGSPYGPRPLFKLQSPYSGPGSAREDAEEQLPGSISPQTVAVRKDGRVDWEAEAEHEEEGDTVREADAPQDDSGHDRDEADSPTSTPSQSRLPRSAAAVSKCENGDKKKARARGKAKQKHPTPPDIMSYPSDDLLASMSRISKLVSSLSMNAPDGASIEHFHARDALSEDGTPVPLAQWQADVLQRVRRMETMLGQMKTWQAQVPPEELDQLRQDAAQLELRVRAVVEQHGVEQLIGCKGKGQGKGDDAVQAEATEGMHSSGEEPDVGALQAGAREQDSDDTDSVSDSAPENSSCPSDCDTGLTEPDLGDRSPQEEETFQVSRPPSRTSLSLSTPVPPTPINCTQLPPSSVQDEPLSKASHAVPTIHTLALKNENIQPEPPRDPVEYLKKYPWTMGEILLLLEVVAHFPPAEHGWNFIAEAYNNLIITRPLQEWFQKQATATNEEDAKMSSLLKKLSVEARQLRNPSLSTSAATPRNIAPAPKAATSATNTKAGERGKAAPFGSADARAEAHARAKSAGTAALPPVTGWSSASKDAHIVTRLPFPFDGRSPADDPSTPPPVQRIVSLPRRRPPLSLSSADAKALSRVMRSATSGVRPHREDSRIAMLALFAATKSRFTARTPWDCWHRWCTPWIVQDAPTEKTNRLPVVQDYVCGNLVLPCSTWIAEVSSFEYHPIPGTYPDALGVQHTVTAGFDPRPGMATYARMAHLTAEKAWVAAGVGRSPEGKVTEEVLVKRRSRLPVTLAGIWPGKGTPPPKPPVPARTPIPVLTPPLHDKPVFAQPPLANGVMADGPVASNSVKPATGLPVVTPTTASTPPFNKPATPSPSMSTPSVPATPSPSRASTPSSGPAQGRPTATGTIDRPPWPFYPIPKPYQTPPRALPRVPHGTLGSTVRPGISAWFDHAAVRLDVLERLADLPRVRKSFDEALESPHLSVVENVRDEEVQERGRGVSLPLHLRRLIIPPPQRPSMLTSSSTLNIVRAV